MSELQITSCPDDPNEEFVPLEGGREDALRVFKTQFPTTTPEALCQKGDSYFLRASQLGNIDVPPSDNPKEQLIRDILGARVNVNFYDMRAKYAEEELSTKLLTLKTMKESGSAGKLPIETLLWEIASAAIAFGLVTEIFKDAGSFLEISFKYLGGLASLFEKKHQMQRIMVERNLCAGTSSPNDMFGTRQLIWKSLPSLLVGGVATYGLIQLGKKSGENGEESLAMPKNMGNTGTEEVSDLTSNLYDPTALRGMTVSELQTLNRQLTDEMADKARQFKGMNVSLKEVSNQIILASMAELKKRDLGAQEDEDISAYARAVLAQEEEGFNIEKFISETGSHLMAIGVGFGLGTHVVSTVYNTMVPWRVFIDKNVGALKREARREAQKEIQRLLDTKVLQQCDEGQKDVMDEINQQIADIEKWRIDFKRHVDENLRHWYDMTGIDEYEKHAIDSLLETLRVYLERAKVYLEEEKRDKALRCFKSIEVVMTGLGEMADHYANSWGDGEVNRLIAYGAGSAAALVAITAGGWALLGGGSLVGGGTVATGTTYTTATGTTLTVIHGGSAPVVGAVTAAEGGAGLKTAASVVIAVGGVAGNAR